MNWTMKQASMIFIAPIMYLMTLMQASGGGVTIVTHGYNLYSDSGSPLWVERMCDAIENEIVAETGCGVSTVARYKITLTTDGFLNSDRWSWDFERTSPLALNSLGAKSGEILIEFDWSDAAGFVSADGIANITTPVSVVDIADKLVNYICGRPDLFGGISLAEQPIHLIGHSRGGAMMVHLAAFLGNRGCWVNQLTTLDPHPVFAIDGSSSLFTLNNNVLFADNYWQNISYPRGKNVPGSYNRDPWEWRYPWDFDLSGVLPSVPHGDVHTWYHGTIDTSTDADDGGRRIDSTIRDDTGWYLLEENRGEFAGFYYSRIKGGTYTGGTRERLADYLPDGTKWERNGWTIDVSDGQNTVWDNIEICNLTEIYPVSYGSFFPVEVRFMDRNNDATITLGVDSDQNPYNGGTSTALYTNTTAAIGGDKWGTRALKEWLSTSSTAVGQLYYVYAKITNGTRTRYYYSHSPVAVVVNDAKVIGLSGDLSFGGVTVNTSSQRTMTVSNSGTAILNVTDISCPAGFSASPKSFSVGSNSSKDVTITFSPTAVQSYGGTVTVTSDKTSGTNTKSCSGTGAGGGGSQVEITSPVGNPPQVGESSVVFRGTAPIGSTRVGYVNSTKGSSNSNWDTVESDGTWGGRSIDMVVGNNSIIITSYNSSGTITGSKSLTVVRLNNIKTASIGSTTCVAFYSGKPKTSHNASSYVGYDPTYGAERTLLQFSFSLPKGSSITGGQLRGETVDDAEQQHGAPFNVTAYMVNAAWGVGASWNSFILGNDVPYVSNGASTQSVPGADSLVDWDVTEICQYWYNGTSNYGFMLKAASSVENGTDWHDRWFQADKFQLTLTYSVETTAPTISIVSPSANSTFLTSSSTVNLAGEASDSQNVFTVAWRNELTGGSGNCTVSVNSWSVNGVALSSGVNRILVTATDIAGNASSDVIEVIYTPPTKIIRISGDLAYGNVIVGNSDTREFFISNDGDAPLAVSGISCPEGFTVNWNNGSIQAAQSQPVTVTFSPTAVKGYSGNFTVNSDKTSGDNIIACSGTGIAVTRIIRLDGDLTFGNVVTNTSLAKILTMHNDGNSPLHVTGISYPQGFTGNWTGGSIPAGESVNLVVTFSPVALQAYTGTITVNSDKTAGTNTTSPVGTGIAATRIIRLVGDLSFGNVPEGETSSQRFTIHNDGNSPLWVSDISCPVGFSDNWSEASIPAGDSRIVTITFSPTAVQVYGGTITVGSNKTSGDNSLSCSGTGILAPEIEVRGNSFSIEDGDVSPDVLNHTDFGEVLVSGGAVVRSYTIYNVGNAALNLNGTPKVVVSGAQSADFSVTAQPSSSVVANGGTASFQVSFNPSASGIRSATLSIANNDTDENPYDFSIQGTGTLLPAEICVQGNSVEILDGDSTPSLLDCTDYGSAPVQDGTVVMTFSICNTGEATLNLTGTPRVRVGGAEGSDFTVTSQPSASVVASGTTTFQVTFNPSDVGMRRATVSIDNDDVDQNPYTFTIQGVGTGNEALRNALDEETLSWTTGGGANWFSQTKVTHDGVDAAQSGNIGRGQSSWMQTTVTGPGTITFWWKASSVNSMDGLRFCIDTDVREGILGWGGGGEEDWQQCSVSVPAGTHALKWEYITEPRLEGGAIGSGSGWVDQVVWSSLYDGDGKADIAVFDPLGGNWYVQSSEANNGPQAAQFGWWAVEPVPADYDGDGIVDIAVYYPDGGTWYILQSEAGTLRTEQWGWKDAAPVPGDYDGDGKADIAVFHQATGNWFIQYSLQNNAPQAQQFGWWETVPAPADYDGDGKTDLAVYCPSTGTWYIQYSLWCNEPWWWYWYSNGWDEIQWGWREAVPVPADYDGDGEADIAVFHRATGNWYIRYSLQGNAPQAEQFGWWQVKPVPADYDGDGKTDIAVYFPDGGMWYIRESATGQMRQMQWGWKDALPTLLFPMLHDWYNLP